MFLFQLGLLLSSVVTRTRSESTCRDRSTTACQRLVTLQPDMCQDDCVATLCPKTCGKCPLTCYSCRTITDPSKCHLRTICSDPSMLCITSETLDGNLQRTFMQGCVNPQVCTDLYGTAPNRTVPFMKRDFELLGGCCATDLCNKYTEPEKTSISTIPPIIAVSSTQNYSQNCKQVDDVACQHLESYCRDPCVSKLCPKTCGYCARQCYRCDNIDHPGNCRSRIMCNGDREVCSVDIKLGGYELTCLDRQTCKERITNAGREGTCCEADFCNGYFSPSYRLSTNHAPITTGTPMHHISTTRSPTDSDKVTHHHTHPITTGTLMHHIPSTKSPTDSDKVTHHHTQTTKHPSLSGHVIANKLGMPTDCHPKMHKGAECPISFHKRGSSCYYAGSKYITQPEAEGECHGMCTRLAIISNKEENMKITEFLTSLRSHDMHEARNYWLDGYLDGSHMRWKSTSTSFNFTNFKPGTPDNKGTRGEHCLELGIGEDDHHHHTNGYYWNDRSCHQRFHSLCEYPLTQVP